MAKDKYRFQKAMNKVSDFVWSSIMWVGVICLLGLACVFGAPWLKTLWETIKFN